MANLDTRLKRLSGIQPSIPWRGYLPTPDGTVDQADRQVIPFLYSGISAGAFVPPVIIPTTTPSVAGRPRRRTTRLLVKINGEIIEVGSVAELFKILHELKKEVPKAAAEKASEIIGRGVKVSEARLPQTIEILEAPQTAKLELQNRINEIDRFYWSMVEKAYNRAAEDEEDMILLLTQEIR